MIFLHVQYVVLISDMAREAGSNALNDCGLKYLEDIDVVVASYCYGEPTSGKGEQNHHHHYMIIFDTLHWVIQKVVSMSKLNCPVLEMFCDTTQNNEITNGHCRKI